MAESSIEWTDYTHNLWHGCQEVGDPDGPYDDKVGSHIDPACHGCYARVRAENSYWWGKTPIFPIWGQDTARRFFADKHYEEPLKWNRAAEKVGFHKRVFCMSMGDWAEGRSDQRPMLDKWLWPMIERTPWLIWLLLTKRPQLANSLVPEHWRKNGWPINAWPGTTAVTQKWWDIRLPHLMKIPASRHFVSAEPLMERIEMGPHRPAWLITGGQSGANAKPTDARWVQSLRDQCLSAGVAFHHKQWGEWLPDSQNPLIMSGTTAAIRVGKKAAGRLLDGRTWDEFPEAQR